VVNDLLQGLDGILCKPWSFPESQAMESKLAVPGYQCSLFWFIAS
jgi:hypothetical protein